MSHSYILSDVRFNSFADDPAPEPKPGDPAPEPKAGDPEPKAGDPDPKNPGKTFTQEDVNRLLAEDRRKHQGQTQKAINELEALKTKARLTQEERNELDERIQRLQDELLTKEELAKKEQERLRKQSQEQVKSLESERDSWKTRYTSSAITRAITDAAASNDAYNPSQIVALLQSNTRLVERIDDNGKPTGVFEPKVRFRDTNKEGKEVELELSPAEAVKRMKELDEYLNLFKGTGVGGLGSNNQPGGKKLDARELAKDPVAYRKARAEGKLAY